MAQASEQLMTTKEVAEFFQVEPRTVARWVKFGMLRAVRLKRLGLLGRATLRFRRADVIKTWEQSERGGGPGLGRATGSGGSDASMG